LQEVRQRKQSTQVTNKKVGVDNLSGRELLSELAAIFLKECNQMIVSVENAIKLRDGPMLYNAAHYLKGSISNFSADSAFQEAQLLELLGQQNGDFQVTVVLSELANYYRKLKSFWTN
jgi:HPt (histidine-containing phosphotransfer) domain-containing protein